MEAYVIYLLLLLTDFAVGENAASAIRDKKLRDPGVLINKLMPQKVYVVPKVNPVVSKVKVNPGQVYRSDNKPNTVPKVMAPVVNQQKNISPNLIAMKDAKPIIAVNPKQEPVKELKKTESVQNENKSENVKDNFKQNLKPKEPQFIEEVDDEDITNTDTKKTDLNIPSKEKEQQDKTKKQDMNTDLDVSKITNINTDPDLSKITKDNPKSNQEKQTTGNPSKTMPIVNEIAAKPLPVNENKNKEITENKTQIEINIDYKQQSGRRANNPDKFGTAPEALYNDAKYAIPITIYNFDDVSGSYSKSRDYESEAYPTGTDYSTYQQTSNVVIKNQDVEELFESSQDVPNPYEPDQQEYYNYEPYETNYYQNYLPKYQNFIPSSPKDRIWRNWKTTEIFISKYQPGFNNNEYKINAFTTPVMNGDMSYDAYNNMPPYQCYVYPTYKYM
ncbi:uncharacterized protein LOC115452967 [Manduca sexta]|uniref:Uncharacterized protein n=1 Tax=Manduca sexta TaxID=7130 RepID=A0A921ZTN6_MANSE|nr:uncharacterized protein LOC115452967 [Manduca sexta]KAG6464295.1 hypothetical protein O3G_MSEX014423 [Manduca sexta]